ncbi:MAG TPA: D-alanine--D-alanine ligase A [Firmicutes bacterium]|nr:D-alanine--D-alanine ligase A [Bacillota bacterium]
MGLRMALIYGGQSGEHEVSVMSASSVVKAVTGNIEILPIGITKDGQWIPGLFPEEVVNTGRPEVMPSKVQDDSLLQNLSGFLLGSLKKQVDLVFPLLHGPMGEDGTIQGLLELAGLPYVGAGIAASAVGMDKALMKAIFCQQGFPIGDYLVFLRKEWENEPDRIITEIEAALGYPCFIKPANMGSSVGISKALDRQGLKEALTLASSYDRKLVIEAFLDGQEVECAVLGNDQPEASIPGEIIPGAEFYSYEDKYIKNDSKLVIPAALTQKQEAEVKELAVKVFKAIDCAGMGRVDFFVLRKDGRVIVNEINTIPGFTQISMYPKLWEATGVSYPKLIEQLIDLAFERFKEKRRTRS